MKVLHVINSLGLGGGAEQALVGLLPELDERGIDSSVAVLTSRDFGLQPELEAAGRTVHRLGPGRTLLRARRLRALVRAERPDLVHATLFDSCQATRLGLLGTGVPSVNSLVNLAYDPVRAAALGQAPWKRRLVRVVDRVGARWATTHVHALTETVAAEARHVLGVPADRITVIPRGRSAEALGPPTPERRRATRAALGVDDDRPVVITVGRQDVQKGQELLVAAAGRLVRRHPELLVLLVGRDGTASAGIRRAIADDGLQDVVRLLGHRTDVSDLMVAADVFAFPSLYEGLGSVLVEAMALGLPIVASDAPAVVEALDDGRAGSVVERGDLRALTAALDAVLADPARRRELAGLGRSTFERRYDLAAVADATAAMYRRLAG